MVAEKVGPIYNVTPEAGQSAEFALHLAGADFFLTAHIVQTGHGYGFTVVDNGVQDVGLVEAELTFWGVPAEPRYDWMRGLACDNLGLPEESQCHVNPWMTSTVVVSRRVLRPFRS